MNVRDLAVFMKGLLEVGQQATVCCEVTPEMFAQFEGAVIHPVYSTVSMVYHMEHAARKLILPFLEDHEEGMGCAVTLTHSAPAGLANKITVTATVTKVTRRFVHADVSVHNERELIGKGTVIQVILPKTEIARKIEQSFKK